MESDAMDFFTSAGLPHKGSQSHQTHALHLRLEKYGFLCG
jgi:hypothetical protein